MATKWRLNPETFMDKVEISRVEKTIARLKIQDAIAIDSYSMSPNGPILSSIYLVGGGYLSEIKMGGKHSIFDVSHAKTLINYRITYGEHETQVDSSVSNADTDVRGIDQSPPATAKLTKFVTLDIRHTESLATKINFFGEDLESWLDFVLEAYPLNLLLG